MTSAAAADNQNNNDTAAVVASETTEARSCPAAIVSKSTAAAKQQNNNQAAAVIAPETETIKSVLTTHVFCLRSNFFVLLYITISAKIVCTECDIFLRRL